MRKTKRHSTPKNAGGRLGDDWRSGASACQFDKCSGRKPVRGWLNSVQDSTRARNLVRIDAYKKRTGIIRLHPRKCAPGQNGRIGRQMPVDSLACSDWPANGNVPSNPPARRGWRYETNLAIATQGSHRLRNAHHADRRLSAEFVNCSLKMAAAPADALVDWLVRCDEGNARSLNHFQSGQPAKASSHRIFPPYRSGERLQP